MLIPYHGISFWLRCMLYISVYQCFGMPGWRVGYALYPAILREHMRKVQDTIPSHACIASQKLALACLRLDEECKRGDPAGHSWVAQNVAGLNAVRDALWPIVGTVHIFL
jgi:aspartate/methionine/tyrosine aminotransferase